MNQQQLEQFCELTAANELEIAHGNQAFIDEHGEGLLSLFKSMQDYLSGSAQLSVESVLNSGRV